MSDNEADEINRIDADRERGEGDEEINEIHNFFFRFIHRAARQQLHRSNENDESADSDNDDDDDFEDVDPRQLDILKSL
ncbi:hypothetical protein TKK_0005157 [Trichogramma kaykai]